MIRVMSKSSSIANSAIRNIDKQERRSRCIGWAVRPCSFHHSIGGLTAEGTLDGNHPPTRKPNDHPIKINNDVADALTDNSDRRLRVRVWGDDTEFDLQKSAGMAPHVLCIDFPPPEDDEDAVKRSWHWFELPLPKDNSRNAVNPVLLDAHIRDVEAKTKNIADGLSFNSDDTIDAKIRQAVLVAAKFHDLGKRREFWQRSIGRPEQLSDKWFGKSGRHWKPRDVTDYRHEFGSLVDLQSVAEFLNHSTKTAKTWCST